MVEIIRRPVPVQDDVPFQKRIWVAERIGWVVMGALLLLALLGVFSRGVLSDTQAVTTDGTVRVDYERFARKTTRSDFTVWIAPPLAKETVIRFGGEFARSHEIDSLNPHPIRASAGTAGLEFVFAPSGAGDLAIHLATRVKRFGIVPITVDVEGRGRVTFSQFVYP